MRFENNSKHAEEEEEKKAKEGKHWRVASISQTERTLTLAHTLSHGKTECAAKELTEKSINYK